MLNKDTQIELCLFKHIDLKAIMSTTQKMEQKY